MTESFQAIAEAILSQAWRSPVRLENGERLDERQHVQRWRVDEGPSSAPATVIVKRARSSEETPYDPDSSDTSSPAALLFNEWAALELLTQTSAEVGPAFYGGDRMHGVLVLEDLGNGESLADTLRGSDPALAETQLIDYATTLGRLHARSASHISEYERLRSALGPWQPQNSPCLELMQTGLEQTFAAIEIPLRPAAQADVQTVLASLRDPGPFLALIHGDSCPDNDRFVAGSLRLFDFESAALRHALLDGVYGRIHFPTCWCVRRLPAELPLKMEQAYRAELVKGCPQAGDDRLFYRATVEMCAAWLFTMCFWAGRDIRQFLDSDRDWGISTIHQRILLRSEILLALTQEFGHLQALGEAFDNLNARLRQRWDWQGEAMPLYPAFEKMESLQGGNDHV